jgi:hypothetical protein
MSILSDLEGFWDKLNNLDGATDLEKMIGAFERVVDVVFDGKMWMSLGWIVLGAILVFVAVVLWLKKDGDIPDVAPIPVPAPV